MPAHKSTTVKRRTQRPSTRATYRPRRITGKGAYTVQNGPWANRGQQLGELIGNYYGGPVGKKIGGFLGRRALHYPARLFGSGAYEVQNSSTTRMAPQVPVFNNNSSDDSVLITHKEYLGDIITGAANSFKIQDFAINPAQIETFPWLCNIAQPNFQQYKFEGLVFEFKSFSADALNSTNTALGSVFACINYDYTDANPSSRYEVENTDWSMACKPSDNMLIPVECAPRQTGMNGLLYVINGNAVPGNADPKMYYLGKLWLGTTGFQAANVNIGSLYVTYKIRLYKPLMTKPLANALVMTQLRGTITNAGPLGTTNVANSNNADAIGVTFTSANVLTISSRHLMVNQRYLFIYQAVGASTASLVTPSVTLSSGLQAAGIFGPNMLEQAIQQPRVSSSPTDVQVLSMNYFKVVSSDTDQTITLGSGTLPTGSTAFVALYQLCGLSSYEIANP